MNQFIKTSTSFLVSAGGIYLCYIISAIYHQKLLKQPYSNYTTGQQSYFGESLLFTLFPPLFATLIGQAILTYRRETINLPWRRCIVVSSLVNINMFTYNQAVVFASFPAIVMAKSCSLLSVIIVGVFFSRVKDNKLKLTHEKLIIGLIATGGIIAFNLFKSSQKNSSDHPIELVSFGNLFLIISLIGDGFLPDLQAQIKSEFKPSAIEMYCMINRFTFLISFSLALLSGSLIRIIDFLLHYQDFAFDVIRFSALNAVGQLFIYRLIKQFRQHIPAFVIAFRKCLTVIINILWFHHSINPPQMFGLALVFVAVLSQVYLNYVEGQKKQKPSNFEPVLENDQEHQNQDKQMLEEVGSMEEIKEPESKLSDNNQQQIK